MNDGSTFSKHRRFAKELGQMLKVHKRKSLLDMLNDEPKSETESEECSPLFDDLFGDEDEE